MLKWKGYGQLHFSILIFGFTAILGEMINLPEVLLVWWRTGLAAAGFVGMAFYARRRKNREKIDVPLRDKWRLMGVGLVLVAHWIAFFAAIKYGSVSVAVVCLSTGALLTAFMEPFFTKRRPSALEFVLGAAAAAGIYLIYRFETAYALGLVLGLISAALSALYGVLNKPLAEKYPHQTINRYELGMGFLVLTLLMPFYYWFGPEAQVWAPPSAADWFWLVVLVVVCTNYAYGLAIEALRHIPTFAYVLAFNLEIIYSIVWAYFFFGENRDVSGGAVLGAALALGSVFLYPVLQRAQHIEYRRKLRRMARRNVAIPFRRRMARR